MSETYQCSVCESDWGGDLQAAVRCCSKGRPTPTTPDIAALLATVGKATKGIFYDAWEYSCGEVLGKGTTARIEFTDDDWEAAVASVNFVRDDLPALIARHDAEVARLTKLLQEK